MKLTLKVVIALIALILVVLAFAVLTTTATVYAEVPDVSKWSCPNAVVGSFPNYGVETMNCDSGNRGNAYAKVSGELIYVHEHRKDANGENVYYNALKTNEGNWGEVTNSNDLLYDFKRKENGDVLLMIFDDNNNTVAERLTPRLKK